MKKFLFVTSRDIITCSGEYKLIISRALQIKEQYGIDTEFLVIVNNTRMKENKKIKIHNEFWANCVTFKENNIISFFTANCTINRILKEKLKSEKNIAGIIVSGLVLNNVLHTVKRYDPKSFVISDIHGANEELLEYGNNNVFSFIFRRSLYVLLEANVKAQLKIASHCFVVSDGLKKHLVRKFPFANKINFLKIPCGSITDKIDFCQYKKNRTDWRKALSINDKDILFVYSGGMSSWQMLQETFDIYNKIAASTYQNTKLLVMSQDSEKIKSRFAVPDGTIVKSFDANIVCDVLCACDFAFMLRGKSITNYVAFPNKFSEYIESMNFIISTDNVPDTAELIKTSNTGVIIDINNPDIKSITDKLSCEKKPDDFSKILSTISYKSNVAKSFSHL